MQIQGFPDMISHMTAEELLEEFALFDDWHDKFQYIIELGDQLEPLPDQYRVDDNLVQGCQSNVWLVAQAHENNGNDTRVEFLADSDSQIVRGLIAILMMLMSGKSAHEIQQLDVESVFRKLELQRHLSRSRSNGLHAMIQRIRELSAQHV
jgi:cysteine desulfuration protein SufE